MLAEDYEGKVWVVDNQRISVTQRQSVLDAKMLAEAGKSAQEIYDILMANKMDSSIYIMLDTLYYLKKGGRIDRFLCRRQNLFFHRLCCTRRNSSLSHQSPVT